MSKMSKEQVAQRKKEKYDRCIKEGICACCYHRPKNNISNICNICRERRIRTYHASEKAKARSKLSADISRLKIDFGITMEDYKLMHDQQEGKCAICNKPETMKSRGTTWRLAVDHSHKDDRIRGLLCHHCNVLLGLCNENIEILNGAIIYLSKHQQVT